ncbi:AraC family transcriptional regulator [Mucilaginibacter sp. RS28]|uniref:AraC family transcriptional regulator n=1 Tax=Mucilaginibacter straminoryzae TaxID=2932774 RepID=A0A9X1X0Z8_9SPHI|nr:helix-turn-helix domain-containing protein [Mucilaginibacter straminoryzae]MCJ8208626.1 AraC family transcriptional regulator [Mucilaginibacter straminoryzae]
MKEIFPVYDIGTLSKYTQEDILISRFGAYLQVHKNLHLPHRHNFYHLVLFTEGSGHHAIDFKNFPVTPHQIYFMIPGQVHSWSFEGKTDGYVVNFSPAFFQSFLQNADYLEQFPFFSGNIDYQVINLAGDVQQKAIAIFEQLINESEHGNPLSADMVRLLLLELFITISRTSLPAPAATVPSYNYTLLKNFQKLIDQNYKALRMPKEYAAMLYITPNHLNALCNDLLGISAGEVIRKRVVLEAKRLLVNFNLSVTEIAGELNFQDNSYFTKFFKKLEGVTPEEFRNEIKSHTK